jgi:hypothetical protein
MTDSEINNRITTHCIVKGEEGKKINGGIKRSTRLGWISDYRKALKEGKELDEALLLKPRVTKPPGPKPVFTPEVRSDVCG